jgi:hypothetical protein
MRLPGLCTRPLHDNTTNSTADDLRTLQGSSVCQMRNACVIISRLRDRGETVGNEVDDVGLHDNSGHNFPGDHSMGEYVDGTGSRAPPVAFIHWLSTKTNVLAAPLA